MICTFFGHKNSPEWVKKALKIKIVKLIQCEKIDRFYVGNNGNFDFYAQTVLRELIEEGYDLSYCIVLSRINESAACGEQAATVFPLELVGALPRFAISKRNEWLIKNSDCVITYCVQKMSNSYKWTEKALKKGLKIIQLSRTE